MEVTTNKLIERMMIATSTKSKRELALLLNISPQAIYSAIRQEKIQRNWIKKISEHTNIAEEWFTKYLRKINKQRRQLFKYQLLKQKYQQELVAL